MEIRRRSWNSGKGKEESSVPEVRGRAARRATAGHGEARRTETQTLGLAAKTSTATLLRAGLVNRSGQNKTAKG